MCVDYIYKFKLYLTNTTLIYKYNLHIIVENEKIYIIILILQTNSITIYRPTAVKGLINI